MVLPTSFPVSPASSHASFNAASSRVSPASTKPFGIFHFLPPLLRIRQISIALFFRRNGITPAWSRPLIDLEIL
jgi:hypothetical protein